MASTQATSSSSNLFPAGKLLYADVIIPLALPNTYTYTVPQEMQESLQPGCRVEVGLGKQKKYAGLVKSISDTAPPYPTKPIVQMLDETPVLYPQQLELWNWIAEYYMCSEGEVMAAALPAHFKLSSETILLYNDQYVGDFSELDTDCFLVAEALEIRKQLDMKEVQQLLDENHVYPVVRKLIEHRICYVWESLQEKYKERTEAFVALHPTYRNEAALEKLLNDFPRAPRQLDLLLAYLHLQRTEGEVSQSELLKKADASVAQLKGLVEKQILQIEKRAVDRIRYRPGMMETGFTLSPAQQQALESLRKALDEKPVCLFHGITGSGKTQVYIKLIEQFFNLDKQVLYLLPEIALTAQMIRRLQEHFGGHIVIYHSKFNNNERVELWNRVKTGQAKIVLGARSALFLPFRDLGLIIVDEEHDASFKQQDPAPRYHARDAAIYYAGLWGAKVILGSATPSLESYYNARRGKYGLVQLTERYGGLNLPEIDLVDTRKVASKTKVIITPQLKEAIEQTIQQGRQVILFQNRRGYAPYLICGTCGYLPQCNHCDVTLTLHKYSNKLHCHYCGTTYPRLVECPACGKVNWQEKNFGTEKIEELIEAEIPGCRVARMDVDAVRGKSAHDNLVRLFEQHRIDVLVGTQMVVKGLDFEKVSLVGILDADGLLSFADFRVNERAFQLMEQVSGRAGRKDQKGHVLIQGTQLQHPVIQLVQQHNYEALFEFELENRNRFGYPPFSRLIRLTLKHKQKDTVETAAKQLAERLEKDLPGFVLGPAAPPVNRVRNYYIMELMVKLPLNWQLIRQYKQLIRNQFNLLQTEPRYKSLVMVADVDAY